MATTLSDLIYEAVTSRSLGPLPAISSLSASDLERAASDLGVTVAHVIAVAAVEAPIGPFLAGGHPTVLFERHLFHRLTRGRWSLDHPEISYPSPGGYGTYAAQPGRLAIARALDNDVAVWSTSWGMFQILGSNYRHCGFYDIEGFEAAMRQSAAAQLSAFVHFLLARKLHLPLGAEDWRAFARGYNGPAYERNAYHDKLERAFEAAQVVGQAA